MSTYEHHGLEANFLDLKRMRKLPVNSEERRRKIIGRCNWYMFGSPEIRGEEFHYNYDYVRLCHTAAPNCPPEQEKPNQKIADKPPSNEFLAKYHESYREGTPPWVSSQDFVPASTIHAILTEAWGRWQDVSIRAKQLEVAIGNIPRPERIKKIVCLGLGPVLTPTLRDPSRPFSMENVGNKIMPRNVAQHLAAIAIAQQLENKTRRQIPIFTADPGYTPQHKLALETFSVRSFVVLDPSYGKHEQFTVIDDSTLVICMVFAPQCPAKRIIEEYARPVAFITSEVPREGKFQDRLWFEVTEQDGNKVQIPGCADLPFPDGCLQLGGLYPRRVRDMFVNEYNLENRFPAEDRRMERGLETSDLVDYRSEHFVDAAVGAYWFSNTRLYVRKHGLARLLGGIH
ncbi:hypothetical protein F5Y13DRAFT_176464 [Hypoxylon sp. FL1857]|nr:hypothetical protein F5Y13DRAFT_176464 [Hypoxylon sp. FL1857]